MAKVRRERVCALKSSSVPLRVVRSARASLDRGPFWAGAASGPGPEQLRWDRGRWGGDEERELRDEERERGRFLLSRCHVMYISHKSPSRGGRAASVCISFAGLLSILPLLPPPTSPLVLFIFSPQHTPKACEVIIS